MSPLHLPYRKARAALYLAQAQAKGLAEELEIARKEAEGLGKNDGCVANLKGEGRHESACEERLKSDEEKERERERDIFSDTLAFKHSFALHFH